MTVPRLKALLKSYEFDPPVAMMVARYMRIPRRPKKMTYDETASQLAGLLGSPVTTVGKGVPGWWGK